MMTARVLDGQESDDGSTTPVTSLSDADSNGNNKLVARLRSTTEPNLSLRVGSSEESICTTTKRLRRQTHYPLHSTTKNHAFSHSPAQANISSPFKGKNQRKSVVNLYSDLDVSHSRNVIYSNINEIVKPNHLTKSPSTSHLHYVRNSGVANKARFNTARSTSALPLQYTAKNSCASCETKKKTLRADSVVSLCEDHETPEGLSWRRLHMSRAKLKATATTSELLSGFAMVAMVELQINKPTAVPEWLFVTFAVCTTILVSVHIFALMISTYLLPSIDAVSKLHVSSLVTESPHDRMKSFIELAWAFSTILGLLLFLVEIAILCWVKFWDYSFTAAMSATMIVIPVLVIFVAFAMHFYHSLVVTKCKTSVNNIQELENMKKQLDSLAA